MKKSKLFLHVEIPRTELLLLTERNTENNCENPMIFHPIYTLLPYPHPYDKQKLMFSLWRLTFNEFKTAGRTYSALGVIGPQPGEPPFTAATMFLRGPLSPPFS